MSLGLFKRGLHEDFIEALQKAYCRDTWWRKIVQDQELFIGLRDNYINVYFNGNSLALIKFEKSELSITTHYKYLLNPSLDKPYVTGRPDGGFNVDNEKALSMFLTEMNDLDLIKRASIPYAGDEKKGVHAITMSNDNVIDVEVAMSAKALKETVGPEESKANGNKTGSKRIDFATFQQSNAGDVKLVFFEAKHFSNQELRAETGNEPKVSQQIKNYLKLLDEHKVQIKDAYKIVSENLLKILPDRKWSDVVRSVAAGADFSIDKEPRLVIFGYDDDQVKGGWWKKRMENLESFVTVPILMRGNPKGFVKGIRDSGK